MPTARHVSLVQKLRWHVTGNISPTAFAIGDVDGQGDNAFVIGNLVGELFIFKGNHPEGLPWLTCKGLGTITAVAIGDVRNWGKNSIVVMSAEGLCHIFDIGGLDDESGGHIFPSTSGITMSPAPHAAVPTGPGGQSGRHTPSVYSSTPQQGSYHGGHGTSLHPSIPATPSIRPVPDVHNHHSSHHQQHHSSHHHAVQSVHTSHGTPPLPPPPQNTPHGSASSSISGFHHHQLHQHHQHYQLHTPNNTPIHSHAGSIHSGIGGARRGSEAFTASGPGSASVARTTAVLANLIGTPPPTSSVSTHAPGLVPAAVARSIGGNSAANSPTGTPLLKPQQVPTSSSSMKKQQHASGANRVHVGIGKTQVRHIGGRRVLDRPNLTLPVPVNINRAYIADIDGDGLNEIVLARTDRILHSYSLQSSKTTTTSPTTSSTQPYNQQLNLIKMLSRTSSISTLDSSGLLSPSDDRRETIIHYPSLSSMGRQYYAGSTPTMSGADASQGNAESQDANCISDQSSRLILVEKKRWALDGQIHCLAVTKDTHTGLPILLVAQPGLKFVMVDHAGNMSEPVTQIQRNPQTAVNVVGPDTPTRVVGSGDVATDIICGTHYVNGEKKDIIGLMSMDGAFALHDLDNNTVKVHDLDSTHKIFGFSKLNFGNHYLEKQQRQQQRRAHVRRAGYGSTNSSRYADENNYDGGDDDDDDENDGDDDEDDDGDVDTEDDREIHTFEDPANYSDIGDDTSRSQTMRSDRPRRPTRMKKPTASSMSILEPFGSRFQKDDMFVGCSWSGITFFIDQDFNTAQYDFDARVCAFGAGQYAVTPGRNEPCLFYVDFEDNIYVYYNLYIQTEPSLQFKDIVHSDASLVHASQKARLQEALATPTVDSCADNIPSTLPGPTEASSSPSRSGREGITTNPYALDSNSGRETAVRWGERDMKAFIHDSLYNVNRYEDEFQRLKRLAGLERAKRMAFLEAEANKARERQEAVRRAAQAESEAALAVEAQAVAEVAEAAVMESAKESPTFMDPRLRRPPHVLTVDSLEGPGMRRSFNRGKAAQRGQFSGHELSMGLRGASSSRQYTQAQHDDDDDDHLLSPLSPLSPAALSSPKPRKPFTEKRRSSLLIKDVLSHYEGKITPPLKSPTSPSASSKQPSKDFKSGATSLTTNASGGSTTTLTNIMKRFSLKDLGNGGRLSRSSTTSSGSSGSGSASGSSQSTVTQGHPLLGTPVLTKGKASALETRVTGKSALRVNRSVGVGVSRTRALGGVMSGRKMGAGARSRLSLQQDRGDDTTEDGEDDDIDGQEAFSEDGTVGTDGDILMEFDRASRKSTGEDDFRPEQQEFDRDLATDEFCRGGQGLEASEGASTGVGGEEDVAGVYTPSTISPIPSPGRFYGTQQGSLADPSASLDSSAFMLAKSLLSPSTRSIPSGSAAAATTSAMGAMGKSSRHLEQEFSSFNNNSYGPLSSSSSSRGHMRQRSGHGLLDVVGMPTREHNTGASSSGMSSGPNSAGHSGVQDGRRSRAESVLSTGSDIGGVIVPDITLMASSFPTQFSIPLSTSEPMSHGADLVVDSGDEYDDEGEVEHSIRDDSSCLGQERPPLVLGSGVRRPPQRSSTLGSQDGAGSLGTGSGSDTATTGAATAGSGGKSNNSSAQRSNRPGVQVSSGGSSAKGVDVKLMPAPLPRSSQHYQRQQLEQTGSSSSLMGPGHHSSHVSFSASTARLNSLGGGGVSSTAGDATVGAGAGAGGDGGGNEGLGHALGNKSSSTTSSATVSDFGSGPSSPLTSNVTAANAILSNPSSSSCKGFNVLSLPVTSPSVASASAQQNYFASSHYHHHQQPPVPLGLPPHSGSSSRGGGGTHPYDRVGSVPEDDRVSIRSRTSTFRDNSDISSILAAATSSMSGAGSEVQHGLYGMSPASTSTTHLVSDSLVRRLEELQQQDRDQEERQRHKEREEREKREKERERERERSKTVPALAAAPVSSSNRPSILSRANSGASVHSAASHHHRSVVMPPPHSSSSTTSHPSTSHGSSSAAPVSGGSGSGSGSGSGPTSASGIRHTWEEEQHESAKRPMSRPGHGKER